MSLFEFNAAAASQGQYESPLGVVAQTCLPDAVYNVEEQFNVHAGHDDTVAVAAAPAGVAAVQIPGTMATQSASDPTAIPHSADSRAADLQGYQEGVRYARRHPEITPPCVLGFNELIVDTY